MTTTQNHVEAIESAVAAAKAEEALLVDLLSRIKMPLRLSIPQRLQWTYNYRTSEANSKGYRRDVEKTAWVRFAVIDRHPGGRLTCSAGPTKSYTNAVTVPWDELRHIFGGTAPILAAALAELEETNRNFDPAELARFEGQHQARSTSQP
jgi:hypothetical protein